MAKCQCGCDADVAEGVRFRRGHNARVMSTSVRQRIGDKLRGRKQSYEHVKKRADALKGRTKSFNMRKYAEGKSKASWQQDSLPNTTVMLTSRIPSSPKLVGMRVLSILKSMCEGWL